MTKANILIADDDFIFCELTKYILTENQYSVFVANDSKTAIAFIEQNSIDLILLDLYFPDYQTGLNTLKTMKDIAKNIPIVFVTSDNLTLMNRFNDLINSGASDIIEKPLQEERLLLTMRNILNYSKYNTIYPSADNELPYLIGESPKIVQVKNLIKKKLQTNNHLMIFADAGVGVENIAKKIHHYSSRNNLPIHIMDCHNMTIKDMQIALFGDSKEKDLAKKYNSSKFVQAENSTLLITNAHLLPEKLQEKMVRALSGRKLSSLNGNSFSEVNTKLIFTTKREYYNDVYSENISPMLFNLCQDKLIIPSLDERTEDIPLIIKHILSLYNLAADTDISISDSALNILKKHSWEENIDGLKNVLLKIIIQLEGNKIDNKDIIFQDKSQGAFIPLPYKQAIRNFEKSYLEQIMEFKDWSLNEAAAVLNIDRSNLFKKLQRHGIKIKKS